MGGLINGLDYRFYEGSSYNPTSKPEDRAYSLLFFVIGSLNLINWLKPEEGT